MDKIMVKEKMDVAKQLVSHEDDPYKMVAYQVILRKLLDGEENDERIHSERTIQKTTENKKQEPSDEFEKMLIILDADKLTIVNELDGLREQCLVLLDHVNDIWPDNDGLTIDQIKAILIEKFRLTATSNDAIRMALGRSTGKYVTRIKIKGITGNKYKYKILKSGKDYVKTLGKANERI